MLIDPEKDLQCSQHLEIEHGYHLNEIEMLPIIERAVNPYVYRYKTFFSDNGSGHQSIMEKCMSNYLAAILDADMTAP